MAEQTMTDLQSAAALIDAQLQLGSNLSSTLHSYGHSDQVVADGVTDVALISDQMVSDYNAAIQTVIDTQYLTARDVLMDQHNTAIDNLHTSINDLVSATAVLATVSAVADMAATADTTQEQLQVQAALTTTDMTIDQADVDNYNSALGAVETFAQEAGAFLAAANNSSVTGAIDSFAQANGVAVASYTAITYTQSVDQLLIGWDAGAYMSFSGYNTGNTVGVDEIYGQIGYVGG
jgi:hypothetical protein